MLYNLRSTIFSPSGKNRKSYIVLRESLMEVNRAKKLIVIVGPTAVGKTEVAVRLAEHWRTEIISADSRQVFAELNIGTAKPTGDQLERVPHHFIGTKSMHDAYDAASFGNDALALINKLFKTHDELIMCGGSGLYIRAALEGFDPMPEVPREIRKKIIARYEAKGLRWLQEQVKDMDPDYYESVDQKNPHRLIRALSLAMVTSQKMSALRKNQKLQHLFQIVKIGLELSKGELYDRIDQRMDQMIADGLYEEARNVIPFRHLNALQTVGYQEIFDELDGKYDQAEMLRRLKRNSRRYAKRQITWFKKDHEINWFRPDQLREIINLVQGPRLPK